MYVFPTPQSVTMDNVLFDTSHDECIYTMEIAKHDKPLPHSHLESAIKCMHGHSTRQCRSLGRRRHSSSLPPFQTRRPCPGLPAWSSRPCWQMAVPSPLTLPSQGKATAGRPSRPLLTIPESHEPSAAGTLCLFSAHSPVIRRSSQALFLGMWAAEAVGLLSVVL